MNFLDRFSKNSHIFLDIMHIAGGETEERERERERERRG